MKILTRTILLLSLVSMLTDISSEMLYPVMPVYLTSIGFSALFIGILEGFAEAIAGFSKGYFGQLSDSKGRRLPFVQIGYGLSSLSKLMMGIFASPVLIFGARTIDRLGKGIRTSARDALLSSETTQEHKGKVFGFHRGADTLGAAIGPILALVFLAFYPNQYQTLFLIAFIPAVLGVVCTAIIREKPFDITVRQTKQVGLFSFLAYWKIAPPEFRKLVIGLLFFALMNSSDLFILMLIKHRGASDIDVIKAYILYNLIYAVAAFPIGILADKIGLRRMLVIGLLIFAGVYGGLALSNDYLIICVLLAFYGIYAAASEGVAKAWITNSVSKSETATALGFYIGMGSIFSLLSSLVAGLLWSAFFPEVTFGVSAVGALVVVGYFARVTMAR
ncbi:MAG: MFS transporter [Ignavibacteria bacterium]|nr:MFS transporter [Ignavibacteria bacterium]